MPDNDNNNFNNNSFNNSNNFVDYSGPYSIENTGQFDYGFTNVDNIEFLPTDKNEFVEYILKAIPSMDLNEALVIGNQIELYDYTKEKESASQFGIDMESLGIGYEQDVLSSSFDILNTSASKKRKEESLIFMEEGLSGKDLYKTQYDTQKAIQNFQDDRATLFQENVIDKQDLFADASSEVLDLRQTYSVSDETNLLQQVLDIAVAENFFDSADSSEAQTWIDEYVNAGTIDMGRDTTVNTFATNNINPYTMTYEQGALSGLIPHVPNQGRPMFIPENLVNMLTELGPGSTKTFSVVAEGDGTLVNISHNKDNLMDYIDYGHMYGDQSNTGGMFYRKIYNHSVTFNGWESPEPFTITSTDSGGVSLSGIYAAGQYGGWGHQFGYIDGTEEVGIEPYSYGEDYYKIQV